MLRTYDKQKFYLDSYQENQCTSYSIHEIVQNKPVILTSTGRKFT